MRNECKGRILGGRVAAMALSLGVANCRRRMAEGALESGAAYPT